jgi:hypothetical protein
MVATQELEKMTDDQFLHMALETLSRELGLYGYARFLRTYRPGTGDYTRDRHQWLGHLTPDDICRDLEAQGHTQQSDPS